MDTNVGLLSFLLILSLLSGIVSSQCIYNDTTCTCSFGSTEASCYERTGSDGLLGEVCRKRACNAGWTCDCEGDYYCDQSNIQVYRLIDFNDQALESNVPCQIVNQIVITGAGFRLGFFHPQFSDSGLLDGQCQNFKWYLDGVLQNEFNSPVSVDAANLDAVKASMSDWNSLPLTTGSVIGFRWAGSPYSCYNSISQLSVNGTEFDTTDNSAVTHRFTNVFENDWFSTDFVEGPRWREPLTNNFGDTYGVENTGITNTYWRIKVL